MSGKNGKRNLTWGEGLLVLFVLVVIAWILYPGFTRSSRMRHTASRTEAISNAKQIFYLLVEFDQEFNQFPGDATAINHEFKDAEGNPANVDMSQCKGTYSNDYFRQFFVARYTNSEEVFYAKGGSSTKKNPDNVIKPAEEILRAGECGFSYVKNLSTSSDVGQVILLAALESQDFKFKDDLYGGEGVVLRVDGSALRLKLDRKGYAEKNQVGQIGETLMNGDVVLPR